MSRPQTPPHEPRYGVRVAQSTIEQLIHRAFPGIKLASYSELDTNKGYNNRVYFLKVQCGGQSSIFRDTDDTERELVLKVNGRFFTADKVQNEVGCIQILRQYCPEIPTPTVFAWSEDGINVTLSDPSQSEEKRLVLSISDNDKKHGGWILMSRLPGKPLSTCELDETARLDIMKQLADITTTWRTKIPGPNYLGNIQFHRSIHNSEPDFTILTNSGPQPQDLVVRGLLMDDVPTTTPIVSVSQRYALKLEEKLKDLENSKHYVKTRHLAPEVRGFITETLPQLGTMMPPSSNFVFTHYDLSPRNILIEGSPPRISGVVDFEFAGFFAPVEEFLNDAVGNKGDWQQNLYDEYLAELGRKGIATPAAGISRSMWDTACCLDRVADNIAPWWLPGPYTGAELDEHFAKTAAELQKSMKILQSTNIRQ